MAEEKSGSSSEKPRADATPSLPEEVAKRPTPVRLAMETGDGESAGGADEVRVILDPAHGQDWLVRVSGSAAGGVLPLRTIPLLDLVFFRAEAPHQPVRRALSQGERLEDLEDEELLSRLRAASPVSGQKAKPEERSSTGPGKRGPKKRPG